MVLRSDDSDVADLAQKCPSLENGYRPTPWLAALDHFGHVMTIATAVIKKLFPPALELDRKILRMGDGGTVALDWARAGSKMSPASTGNTSTAPIVVIMHGLCGCSESWYVRTMALRLMGIGFRPVIMVARGCGGLKITSPTTFTAANTSDFSAAVACIQESNPGVPIFGVGFSLGAGILAKYLGETGSECPLSGAVCVSPSWNFLNHTPWFSLWSRLKLVTDLKGYVESNRSELERLLPKVDMKAVMASRDVREFDSHAVVPVHGYADVDAYYTDASAKRLMHRISTPTVALSAGDDPVCKVFHPESRGGVGPGLALVYTEYGGHVAFSSGWNPSGTSWCDEVAAEWFSAILQKNAQSGGSKGTAVASTTRSAL